MSEPTISVAMSVYNGERFLSQAIESILSQSMPDFEFLILNDGSSDASGAIIDGYAQSDRRIRAIHRENRGLIASLNELVEKSRAPLIARMDADDISKPDRFAQQLDFLRANPDHAVLGTWSEDIDTDGNRIWLTGDDQPVTHEEFTAAIEADATVCCHPSVIMRRDAVQSVGGYHAAFKHCEDYDLWLRLAHSHRLANLPIRLLQYRQSPEQVTKQNVESLTYGAIVARIAYDWRKAGRPDPTENITSLPTCEELDAFFGQFGLTKRANDRLFANITFSPDAMRGESFERFLHHIRHGGDRSAHWRTVARLALRMHDPVRAARLAAVLAQSFSRPAEQAMAQ